jgi:hypothetical protein
LVGYAANGDVTPEMADPLIATHFWRNAPDGTGESDGNPLEVKVDKYAVLESNVQIFGAAFLGLTLQCSRCHDHKFEPVKQEDYYALQAIMRPAFDIDHWLKPNERVIEVGLRAEREARHKKTAEVERDLKTLRDSLEGLTAPFRKQAIEANLAAVHESLRKSIQKALDTKEKDRSAEMKSLLKTNVVLVEVSEDSLRAKFPAFAAAAQTIREAATRREADRPAPDEKIARNTTQGTKVLRVRNVLLPDGASRWRAGSRRRITRSFRGCSRTASGITTLAGAWFRQSTISGGAGLDRLPRNCWIGSRRNSFSPVGT